MKEKMKRRKKSKSFRKKDEEKGTDERKIMILW